MSKKETVKRYVIFIIGLFFTALGVSFSKHGGLGVTTISSVSNVLSCRFTSITIGTWMIVWNFILIAAQVAILRKNFKPIQFLQIPVAFMFGYFTDFGLWCISPISVNNYLTQLMLVFVGIVILACGVSLTFIADVVLNSGEGVVKAISDVTGMNVGNTKTLFDIFCVASAIILSLIFFDMKIVGTREGTLIAALCTGTVVKFFNKKLQAPLNKFFEKENVK